jgi:hypothetical protein
LLAIALIVARVPSVPSAAFGFVGTLLSAGLLDRRAPSIAATMAFSFACVLLEWPILTILAWVLLTSPSQWG